MRVALSSFRRLVLVAKRRSIVAVHAAITSVQGRMCGPGECALDV